MRALALAACLTLSLHAQDAPKPQVAPDQRAYKAAAATQDPDQKIAALRQFLADFPDSKSKDAAHTAILNTLLDHYPGRTSEIEPEAKNYIKGDKKSSKWSDEVTLARKLAAAEPAGADLPFARKCVDDALKNYTEPRLSEIYHGYFKGENQPKPAEVHRYYATTRARALAASAFIDYRQNRLPEATAQLDEAYALNPLSADVNALRGNIAYAQHHNPEALEDLERAQVSGALSKHDRDLLQTLFTEAHPAGDLQADLDTRYRQLYPAPFTPAPHPPVPAGHTALVELYTGSGCPPCVAGDLAVDTLLDHHPRTEVIALVYDLHIPRIDPLTNPDSIARAAVYNINSTPSYILDGKRMNIYGGDRFDSEEVYGKLLTAVDSQSVKPSPVQLTLTSTPAPEGTVSAHATVTLGDLAALTSPTPPADLPSDTPAKPTKPAPAAAPAPAKPAAPMYVLNFALVEDEIRYSGENGVRFHRMVVRALALPSAPLDPGHSTTQDTTFHLADIATRSREYLDNFEKNPPDRFPGAEFLTKDTTLNPAHLAIVAWVQDPTTHRILQSTFLPLNPTAPQSGGTR